MFRGLRRPYREMVRLRHRHSFRVEKDSMGSVQVPIDDKWGAQTQRAVENFKISSWKMPPSLLRNVALLKACVATVNGEMKLLDRSKAQCIHDIAMSLYNENDWKYFPVDVFQTGSGTSTNMNMNEVISNLAFEKSGIRLHPNDDVNKSQSSNDVIPTAISMAVAIDGYHHLLPAVEELIRKLTQRARGLTNVIKSGRTHLMDATPLTMEQEIMTWVKQLQDSASFVENALFGCYMIPIGGTAIGTGIQTVVGYDKEVVKLISTKTNMPFQVAPNKASRMASQDHIVAVSGALKTLAITLYKICNDLRWMHSGPSAGLREISLPPVQPGSSIMPGKDNPVICESALMAAVNVIGSDQIIAMAGQAPNFQLHTMLPLVAFHIINNIELLSTTCLNVALKAIDGFSVNQQHVDLVLSMNSILVTNLSPLLGYNKCADIVHKAMAENRSLLAVAIEETDLDPSLLEDLLNPASMTHPLGKDSNAD